MAVKGIGVLALCILCVSSSYAHTWSSEGKPRGVVLVLARVPPKHEHHFKRERPEEGVSAYYNFPVRSSMHGCVKGNASGTSAVTLLVRSAMGDDAVPCNFCSEALHESVSSLLSWASARDMSSGLISESNSNQIDHPVSDNMGPQYVVNRRKKQAVDNQVQTEVPPATSAKNDSFLLFFEEMRRLRQALMNSLLSSLGLMGDNNLISETSDKSIAATLTQEAMQRMVANENGFVLVISGWELEDPSSQQLSAGAQEIYGVVNTLTTTCPLDTLVIVAGLCPTEDGCDSKVPLFAGGPGSDIVAKTKSLWKLPIHIRKMLSMDHRKHTGLLPETASLAMPPTGKDNEFFNPIFHSLRTSENLLKLQEKPGSIGKTQKKRRSIRDKHVAPENNINNTSGIAEKSSVSKIDIDEHGKMDMKVVAASTNELNLAKLSAKISPASENDTGLVKEGTSKVENIVTPANLLTSTSNHGSINESTPSTKHTTENFVGITIDAMTKIVPTTSEIKRDMSIETAASQTTKDYMIQSASQQNSTEVSPPVKDKTEVPLKITTNGTQGTFSSKHEADTITAKESAIVTKMAEPGDFNELTNTVLKPDVPSPTSPKILEVPTESVVSTIPEKELQASDTNLSVVIEKKEDKPAKADNLTAQSLGFNLTVDQDEISQLTQELENNQVENETIGSDTMVKMSVLNSTQKAGNVSSEVNSNEKSTLKAVDSSVVMNKTEQKSTEDLHKIPSKTNHSLSNETLEILSNKSIILTPTKLANGSRSFVSINGSQVLYDMNGQEALELWLKEDKSIQRRRLNNVQEFQTKTNSANMIKVSYYICILVAVVLSLL